MFRLLTITVLVSVMRHSCTYEEPYKRYDFSVMLNSVIAAQAKQSFIYRNWEVETPGNPLAHTILRGAVNKHGQNIPNYHYEDLINLPI